MRPSRVSSAAHLSEAVECLLGDAPARERLGKRARERVIEKFGWDSLSRIFLNGIGKYMGG